MQAGLSGSLRLCWKILAGEDALLMHVTASYRGASGFNSVDGSLIFDQRVLRHLTFSSQTSILLSLFVVNKKGMIAAVDCDRS